MRACALAARAGASASRLGARLVHTMDELRLTGNCLKASRPFLVFDKSFDFAPHLQLTKELLTEVRARARTPCGCVECHYCVMSEPLMAVHASRL
jgi:hypothetical protein